MKISLQQLSFDFFVYLAKKAKPYQKVSEKTHFFDHFADLTPKADKIKSAKYQSALKWALDNQDIYNIAVSGPYGSGKSSILKAFQEVNPQYQYLPLSLASFKENSVSDTMLKDEPTAKGSKKLKRAISQSHQGTAQNHTELSEEDFHRLIEFSILQQMLYRKPANNFPLSRFKRIENPKLWTRRLLPAGIIAWILAAVFLFIPSIRENFYRWKNMAFEFEISLNMLTGAIFVFGIYIITAKIVEFSSSAKLSKINLSGGEIEMSKDLEGSILNKYFDEILYFFDCTRYDVVIIEDLDRFNDPEIFTKLRELNLMLNQSEKLNRHIRFIYAIKDDMFLDKNRTKFFDFILPIIPHINSSNSLDMLKTKFSSAGLLDGLPTKFLYDIMLYVDDMRVLNNITNEFILYRENLNIKELDLKMDKLLAIIIYKNIYPNDFAALHCNDGDLFKVFSEKQQFIETILSTIDDEIVALENEIEQLENEQLSNLHELRSAYVQYAFELFPGSIRIGVPDRLTQSELVDPENFEKLRTYQKLSYLNEAGALLNRATSFLAIEKKSGNKLTYEERSAIIEKKSQGLKEKLSSLKNVKLSERINVRKQPIRLLLDKYKKFHKIVFDARPLLGYLVREGHIDEMYEMYISYFYKQSLTISDLKFLKQVRDRKSLDFGYHLENITELFHRLDADDMALDELMNFDVAIFLILNKDNYSSFHNAFFKNLGQNSETSISFITSYLKAHQEKAPFLTSCMENFPGIWEVLSDSTAFSEDEKEDFLGMLFTTGDIDQLISLNVNDSLKYFLQNSANALLIFNSPDIQEKAKAVIDKLGIHFAALNEENLSSPLYDDIYRKGRYKFNLNMFWLALLYSNPKGIERGKLKKLSEKAHYSTITEYGGKELIEDINELIALYVSDVYSELKNNKNETEATLKFLLASANTNDEKSFIISNTNTIFKNLDNLDQKLWSLVLNLRKIEPTWSNIMRYRSAQSELDEVAINWLNEKENYMELGLMNMPAKLPNIDFGSEQMEKEIILSSKISIAAFEKLIVPIKNIFTVTKTGEFESERALLLVRNGNIAQNPTNFEALRDVGGDAHLALLRSNFRRYLQTAADYVLIPSDYIKLLDGSLSKNYKAKLIGIVKIVDIEADPRLANIIIRVMLESSELRSDLDFIVTLFNAGRSFTTRCVQLFNRLAPNYNNDEVSSLLKAMNGKFAKIGSGKYPSFDRDEDIDQMFKILEDKKIAKLTEWKDKFRAVSVK